MEGHPEVLHGARPLLHHHERVAPEEENGGDEVPVGHEDGEGELPQARLLVHHQLADLLGVDAGVEGAAEVQEGITSLLVDCTDPLPNILEEGEETNEETQLP